MTIQVHQELTSIRTQIIMTHTLANLLSIGITTKNRWQDLQITLQKIIEADLCALPIYIFDDHSDQPCPFDLANLPLKIELRRFSDSKGLIVRRNQLAQVIPTKYYLSLDDDSFPAAGSLQAAVEFIELRKDIFCLSFPVFKPIVGQYENKSIQDGPYQVRCFIGCGHLLQLEHFRQLGGYREELVHQGEEMEIAARALQQDLYCYHFPGFEIHHNVSNSGRNWQRMDYYGSRNTVLWNDWFVPPRLKLIKQLRTFVSRILLIASTRRFGFINGEIAGFRDIARYKACRQEMPSQYYHTWQSLPWY